jgi:hypothetical protein
VSIPTGNDCLVIKEGRRGPFLEVNVPKYLFLIQHKVGAYDGVSADQMQEILTK